MFTNMSFVTCASTKMFAKILIAKNVTQMSFTSEGSIKLESSRGGGVGDPHRSGLCQPLTAVNNFDVFSSIYRERGVL